MKRLDAAAVFAFFATIFWFGRSHSFGGGDSPQHMLAALTWSVPHPPGYPLQTALGWLWSRLPWGDPGAAVNGLSGIFSAGAAALLFLHLKRSSSSRAASLTGAALMALAPLFWYYSLVAEVRALNDLLALACALLAADWAREGKPRSLALFSFCLGLGLSHHPTFLFLLPAFAVWLSARRPSANLAAACAMIAVAALAAPYLLLGARLAYSAPVYNLFEVNGWGDLPGLFARTGLGGPLRMAAGAPALGARGFDFARCVEHAGWFASAMWTHAGPVGLGLAALGAASLLRKERRELAAWMAWFVASAGIFLVFSSQQLPAVEPEYARAVAARFYLLPMIAVFALAGYGARELRPWAGWALLAGVFLAPLLLRPMSLSAQNPLLDYTRALVRDSKPGDFVVLGSDDTIFAALDLELVRRETGGRVFLCPTMFAFPSYQRRLARTYPGIVLPPLTTDWAAWKKLNPGRAVVAEASLRGAVLYDFPLSVPQGSVIRVETARVKSEPSADALRFLDAPETASFLRAGSRPWTQEVYILQSRLRQADWLAGRLDPRKDAALLARLNGLMDRL